MALSRWDRKVIYGSTTALAALAGSALAVTAIQSDLPIGFLERLWWVLGTDIYTSVGIPAFVAGALFFPVGIKALASRFGFALRAAGTAATASLVNRVLVWASYASPDSIRRGLGEVWATPQTLWPAANEVVALGLDWNGLLGVGATLLAGGLAWSAQPLLKRIAKQPRLRSEVSLEAQPVRVPARVSVR